MAQLTKRVFHLFLLLNKRNAKKQVFDDFLEHFSLGRRNDESVNVICWFVEIAVYS